MEDEHLVIAPDLVSFEKAEEVLESSPDELSQEEVENLPRKRLENPIDLPFPAREEETRPLEDLKEPSLPDLSQIKAIFDGAPKSKEATLDRFERAEESEAVMPESLPSEPEESNISEDSISTVEEDIMSRESRKKTNRLATKVSTIIVSLLVALLLAGAFFTYTYVKSAIEPVDKNSTEFVQVEIPSGSGNKLIGQILEENGIIKNATVFNLYTKFKNYSGFQSGYYNFQKSMSLDDIAKYLQEGGTSEPTTPALGKIVIPEGYTLKQISEAVTVNTKDSSNATPFTAEDFMATVQDETFIAELQTKYPNLLESLPEATDVKYQLEGYLFPATYEYYQETSLKDLIEQMVAAMDANLSPYYAQIKNGSMTVNQVLTMASLVEKEGATDDDREMIASVFYNRWNIDMPLQSNIAILYAMDKLGQETTLAEDAAIDTSIDSPYNIYSNTGLMPGPVDSPGMSAILATINPAKTDYYYFVADVKTGAVYFAKTYEEHSANVEKYINSQLQ
ncbi:endolytic transglycosylase MltG [Streptococcus plurextorum]|uniref:endolytic transglycosylase MltG n=1 Tax=Streptococcus plurextorum TaxID=456876 RepID=UPI003CCB8F91